MDVAAGGTAVELKLAVSGCDCLPPQRHITDFRQNLIFSISALDLEKRKGSLVSNEPTCIAQWDNCQIGA